MGHEIGEFLRTRRARIQPADAGLPDTGRRRVPGLRREELAQLAGVSVDYYVRLAALIDELSLGNETFRRLWSRHPVREKTHGDKVINHPVAGRLEFRYETLALPDDPDQLIVAYCSRFSNQWLAYRSSLNAGTSW